MAGTDGSGGGGGGGGSTPGHAPEVPIASCPRPPARLDRRKAFLWEPPGHHVTLPGGQSRLRAASAGFLAARRPRLLLQPRPFPAADRRVRCASRALPCRRALPGDAGAERGLRDGWELMRRPSRLARRPRSEQAAAAGDAPERKREVSRTGLGSLKERHRGGAGQRRVAIRDVEEHGVVGPLPEGGRGRI